MDKPERPPSLDDLEARLRAARDGKPEQGGESRAGPRGNASGLGVAARITVELVVATLVGFGIGWALDRWLGTAPWMMLLFLLLGGAGGVMNAYRAAKGLDDSVGLGAAQRRRRDRADKS